MVFILKQIMMVIIVLRENVNHLEFQVLFISLELGVATPRPMLLNRASGVINLDKNKTVMPRIMWLLVIVGNNNSSRIVSL